MLHWILGLVPKKWSWMSFCLPFTAELLDRVDEIVQIFLKNAKIRRKSAETWKLWERCRLWGQKYIGNTLLPPPLGELAQTPLLWHWAVLTNVSKLEWVRESGESIMMFRGQIYAGSTYVARLQKHRKTTTWNPLKLSWKVEFSIFLAKLSGIWFKT